MSLIEMALFLLTDYLRLCPNKISFPWLHKNCFHRLPMTFMLLNPTINSQSSSWSLASCNYQKHDCQITASFLMYCPHSNSKEPCFSLPHWLLLSDSSVLRKPRALSLYFCLLHGHVVFGGSPPESSLYMLSICWQSHFFNFFMTLKFVSTTQTSALYSTLINPTINSTSFCPCLIDISNHHA